MPKVGDLSKCKIYKITSLNNPELVYYGHTFQTLAQRFSQHKSPVNTSTSKLIIEKGDAVILLVEDYPCESIDIARAREGYYILNNPCVNKCVSGRTHKEYIDTHKEEISVQRKQYCETHKDQISKQSKLYRETNQDKIQEYKKKYRELHKEEKKEYQKQYYLKKKSYKLE